MSHAARALCIGALTTALMFGQSCAPSQRAPGSARVESTAPDFTVELQNAETFRLADHIGKDVVLLDFWTTFCEPCVAVLRHLEVLHTKYQSRGLVVLAVSMDPPESAARIGPFVQSHGLTVLVAHDRDSQIADLYNKRTVAPYQVLIGRDGQVLSHRLIQVGDEAAIESAVVEALGSSERR